MAACACVAIPHGNWLFCYIDYSLWQKNVFSKCRCSRADSQGDLYFKKELSSGGLSAALFRHPAGSNGFRVAPPPLHRLCIGMLCAQRQVVRPWWWIGWLLLSIWSWRTKKDRVMFSCLVKGPPCKIIGLGCNFIYFWGLFVIVPVML
jgi:hypothetical protein